MFVVSIITISIQKSGNLVQLRKTIDEFYVFYGITPIGKLTGQFKIGTTFNLKIKWETKGYFQISFNNEILAYVKPKELFWKIRYLKYYILNFESKKFFFDQI